jgi:hypothetical protein
LNGYRIFIFIILPYLKISEAERESMANDPKEFVNLQIDTCSKQKSKTYKTQAAKLLEHLVDNVDGMLTFCTQFVFEVYDIGVDPLKEIADSQFLK